MARATSERTGAVASSGRSTVLSRADAFIAQKDTFTRQDLRAWLPELIDLYVALREPYHAQNLRGVHTTPNPDYSLRLAGLLELIGRAEMMEVADTDGNLHAYPLEKETAKA